MRLVLAGLLLASCTESEIPVGSLETVTVLPALPTRDLDILFVIDDSPSMLANQEALAASFPRMIDTLALAEGESLNLHIGVTTTDMGTMATNGMTGATVGSGPGLCAGAGKDGTLRSVPEVQGNYMFDVALSDGSRIKNYTGQLGDAFAQLAAVGQTGCGFEQPLHAMQRALTNPANTAAGGFLRREAALAVVIVTDEDDCSFSDPYLIGTDLARLGPLQSFRCTRFGVTCDAGGQTPDAMNQVGTKAGCHANETSPLVSDVQSYVDFLKSLKDDPNAVMVSVIAGDPNNVATQLVMPPGGGSMIPGLAHSCAYGSVDMPLVADPAVRLAELVASFPNRGEMTSICSEDLTQPMETIGAAANRMLGDPCIATPLADTSDEPGLQPSCEVVEGPPGGETTPVPPCGRHPNGTCWSLLHDTQACAGIADGLRLQITRPTPPPTQLYARLKCLTR